METVATKVEHPTFETVWAILQENATQLRETDRIMKEREKERLEREEKEKKAGEELDRRMKRLDRQMGLLHNKFGKLAEHLVLPGIKKRFNELGYKFTSSVDKGSTIYDEDVKIKAEIDALLENGEYIIAVEIKTDPKVKDVGHHIRRLEILREFRYGCKDYRKILGAIAGAIFETDAKKATIEAGMYVLEQSGDTMKMDIPEGFVPREW